MAVVNSNIASDIEEIKLSSSEKKAVSFFETNLDDKWEIYLKPFLNGCSPDLVLLNPEIGVAVFDIKDWDFYHPQIRYIDDRLCLSENEEIRKIRNPLADLRNYRYEIFNLYCPRLDGKYGLQVIKSGLIFPNADQEEIESVFKGLYSSNELLIGKKIIEAKDLKPILSSSDLYGNWMSEDTAADLRSWLIEPDYSSEQREPIELNSTQKQLIFTRTDTGFRRIRGAAGAGKSVVIASRAAILANAGLKVLVVSFNITLLQYLRDLCARYPHANPNKITWLNFHEWLKRTVLDLELDHEYNEIWGQAFVSGEKDSRKTSQLLERTLPEFLLKNLSRSNLGMVNQYDAILTDEGQDFHPLWWQVLRKVLNKNGEMLMAADLTQDIYSTTRYWTDTAMKGAGFSGKWGELTDSHRLPIELIPIVQDFSEKFLRGRTKLIPLPPKRQHELFETCEIKWMQVNMEDNVSSCVEELLNIIREDTHTSRAMVDLTLLVDSVKEGQKIANELLSAEKDIKVTTTFVVKNTGKIYDDRRKKLSFWKGSPKIKISTLQSFKGWEARLILINITSFKFKKQKTLFYTGLTRLKKHPQGSFLTIICADKQLESFGKEIPGIKFLPN